jgi:hypothetical protein
VTTATLPAVAGPATAPRGAGRAAAGHDTGFDAALASAAGETTRDASSHAVADASKGAAEPRLPSSTAPGGRAGRSLPGGSRQGASAGERAAPDGEVSAVQDGPDASAPPAGIGEAPPAIDQGEPEASDSDPVPAPDATAGFVAEQRPIDAPVASPPAGAAAEPDAAIDTTSAPTGAATASIEAGPPAVRTAGAAATVAIGPADGPQADAGLVDARDAAGLEAEAAVEPAPLRQAGEPADEAAAPATRNLRRNAATTADDGAVTREAGDAARAVLPSTGSSPGGTPQIASGARTGMHAKAAAMLAAAIDASAPRAAGQGTSAADGPAVRATHDRQPPAPAAAPVPAPAPAPAASAVPVPPLAVDPAADPGIDAGTAGTEPSVSFRIVPVASGQGIPTGSGRDPQSGSLPWTPAIWPVTASAVAGSDAIGSPVRLVPPGASLPLPADVELAAVGPQLIRHLHMQVRDGGGQVRLTLSPEHLGAVTIELRVNQQQVAAMLAADTPAVRGWLSAHEQDLKSGLAELGLHLDELVVRDEDAGRRQQERQEQPRSRGRRTRDAAEQVFDVRV